MQLRSLVSPVIALLVIGVSIAAFIYLKSTKPFVAIAEEEEKVWPVTVKETMYGTHQPQLTLLGHVESPSSSQMTAAIDADVVRNLVQEGWKVKEGQLMVELDSAEALMNQALQEAEVESLQAQVQIENNNHKAALEAIGRERKLLALNRAAVEREKRLFQKKLGTESRLDQSKITLEQQALAVNAQQLQITNHLSRLNQLQANLKRAETLLERAKLDIQRTRIIAPFAGRISKVYVSAGERVSPGKSIIDLYAADRLEARALIPERYLATITAGMDRGIAVTARVEHLGDILELTLDRFSGAVDQARGGVDGIFSITGANGTLPLGKPLQLVLDLPPLADTLGIPIRAVFSDNRVYKVSGGRLQVVSIEKLGESSSNSGERLVIARSDGLVPGDTYITTQLPNPVTGLRVAPLSARSKGNPKQE